MERMMLEQSLMKWSLIAGALGSGLIGGIFFAFSTFIMTAFAAIPTENGIAAMNAINRVIVRSWFMPVFLGTVLVAAVLVVLAIRQWSLVPSGLIMAGAALYIVASFISTIVFNVPLNDKLATFPGNEPAAVAFWATYLKDWTFWNHVRTVASLAASVAFMAAIR
jgi:uncharacterized membrane protein